MRLCLIAALGLLLAGCAFERNGVVRHVVIGFGVVTVPKTNTVALVTRIQALGAYCGTGVGPQFSLGYVNGVVTQIDSSATNLVLEIK
jgi:hypothetical protein